MVRPYLKNIALIDSTLEDCIASTGFYVCRGKENLDSRYLYHFLCSKDAIDYLMQFMKGDNSPSIRKDDLLEMPVSMPSRPEQAEIVRILDSLLAKEQQAKEAAEAVLEKIDLLKKSILARAFRGELGTNDPTEESAVELLKTVL
jgi:type I restriction enzyme S subunit